MQDPVITVDRYEHAREQSDDVWTDWDVFHEERDSVDLREIVLEVVEGMFTHPSGEHSVYEVTESANSLVWDKVTSSSGLVPKEIPQDVTDKFARNLESDVSEYAEELYKDVREEAEETDSIGELQDLLEKRADELSIPHSF